MATIAAGMGMDVPSVRLVVNFGKPTSLTDLVQRFGRGGRDGLDCVVIAFLPKTCFSKGSPEHALIAEARKKKRKPAVNPASGGDKDSGETLEGTLENEDKDPDETEEDGGTEEARELGKEASWARDNCDPDDRQLPLNTTESTDPALFDFVNSEHCARLFLIRYFATGHGPLAINKGILDETQRSGTCRSVLLFS